MKWGISIALIAGVIGVGWFVNYSAQVATRGVIPAGGQTLTVELTAPEESDCPVTGCNGEYHHDEPCEEQRTGEQILAELASGHGFESTAESRHERLKQASEYFQDSVACNTSNEDAHYGLAYSYASLATTYFNNDDEHDDDQGIQLLERALSSGEKAKDLAKEHKNSTIVELASNLVSGITEYLNQL